MKAKTARPLLLVMLFGFLASNGWMITEYGPGTGASGTAPPSAALGTPQHAVRGAAKAQRSLLALQPISDTTAAPTTGAEPRGTAATAPQDWLPAISAPMLAATVPVNPEVTLPNDPASDLAFPGATNLDSGGNSAAAPADPPVVGAQPAIGTASPPIAGGEPHAKKLAEPGSLALLIAGLIVLAGLRRRARAA